MKKSFSFVLLLCSLVAASAQNLPGGGPQIPNSSATGALSVFGRTGAIIAVANDYSFSLIAGKWTLAQSVQFGANQIMANVTGSAAQPTLYTIPACASDGAHGLTYTGGSGFACTVITTSGLPTGNNLDTVRNNGGGTSYLATSLTALLNAVCSNATLRSGCTSFFQRYDVRWFGALCDGSTDDFTAIQAASTAASAATTGGEVFIPAGICTTSANIVVNQQVMLTGVKGGNSVLKSTGGADTTVVVIDNPAGTNWGGGIRDLFIIGGTIGTPVNAAVKVTSTSVGATIKDCQISGGSYGLQMEGGDGVVADCFIMGLSGGINQVNNGANFYHRLKLDTSGPGTVQAAFLASGAGVQEIHMTQTDMSGNFTDAFKSMNTISIVGDITGVIFGGPVTFANSGGVNIGMVNSAFSGNVTVTGTVRIVASDGGGGATATGATCAGNTNITC